MLWYELIFVGHHRRLQESYEGEISRMSLVQNEMIKLNTEQLRWPTWLFGLLTVYIFLFLGLHG
jgi:hypothetical protein